MNGKAQIAVVVLTTAVTIVAAFRIAGNHPERGALKPGREIVDMASRKVRIPVQPQRILSLCTSATDTIVRIGAGERLAAIDEYSCIVPGAKDAVIIGKGSAISREQVIALGIDLAFIWWYQDDAADLLERLSVSAVRIRSGRMTEVPAMIRLVGKCLNRSQTAENLAEEVAGYIRSATSRPVFSRTRVYLELYGPLKTVGGNSYINDLIELAGGRNIAGDASSSVLLSAERLIESDPDVILFVEGFATVASITRRSGMGKLTAVESGHIHPIDRYWLVAGAGIPAAEANLRKVLADNSNFVQER
ncbi:MAG: ABC transporter substrate-binding protein [Planctomycetota bacterium]